MRQFRAKSMFEQVGGTFFKCPYPNCFVSNFYSHQQAETHYRKEHESPVPPFYTFVDLIDANFEYVLKSCKDLIIIS
jgi:hypothetical protein